MTDSRAGARRLPAGAVSGALLCSGIAWVAYVAYCAPSLYWLDSSEFAAAAFGLGVPHPPGQPLAVLLGKALTLIPLGSIAFRANLASALLAAIAAGLLFLCARHLYGRLAFSVALAEPAAAGDGAATGHRRGERALAGQARGGGAAGRDWLLAVPLAAALFYALSGSAWLQATRAEVYALEAAILFGVLWLLLLWLDGDVRGLYGAGLLLGLGIGNHHYLTLTCGGAMMLAALVGRRPGGSTLLRAGAAFALGVAILAYLPLRAAAGPEVNWGDPQTAGRFLWVVSAAAFQKSVSHPHEAREIADLVALFMQQLHPLPAMLALGGIYVLLRRRASRAPGALLVALLAADVVAQLAVLFDPQNPDAHGYLLGAMASLSLCAFVLPGLASAWLADAVPRSGDTPRGRQARCPRLAAAVLSCAALALAGGQALRSRSFADLSSSYGAEITTRAALDQVPGRGLLLSSYFRTVFNLWYLRGAEGERPDIDHIHGHFLAYPGYEASLGRRLPHLAGLLRAYRHNQGLPVADLAELSRRRPVLTEYDFDTPEAAVPHLRASPPLYRFQPLPVPAAERERSDRAAAGGELGWELLVRRLGGDLNERETRMTLLWLSFLDARFHCQMGSREAGNLSLGRAERLAPGSPEIAALRLLCGPLPPASPPLSPRYAPRYTPRYAPRYAP